MMLNASVSNTAYIRVKHLEKDNCGDNTSGFVISTKSVCNIPMFFSKYLL